MHKAVTKEKINKAVTELENLGRKTKRKLLELEIALGAAEIQNGEFYIYERAEDLIKEIKP